MTPIRKVGPALPAGPTRGRLRGAGPRALGAGPGRQGRPDFRLILPAPMEPQVLGRVLADEAFEGRGEALGQDADVVGRAGQVGGVDDVLAADLVAEPGPD